MVSTYVFVLWLRLWLVFMFMVFPQATFMRFPLLLSSDFLRVCPGVLSCVYSVWDLETCVFVFPAGLSRFAVTPG